MLPCVFLRTEVVIFKPLGALASLRSPRFVFFLGGICWINFFGGFWRANLRFGKGKEVGRGASIVVNGQKDGVPNLFFFKGNVCFLRKIVKMQG